MTTVVPAIIPHTKEQFEEEIKKIVGFSQLVQIDISDGIFTPIKTWPYNGRDLDYFEKLKKEEDGLPMWKDLNFEIHLMVKDPEKIVKDWISAGAGGIVAHIEATEDFQEVIDICRENFVLVGVAIKPSTDISKLEKIVPQVDFIQCMGSDSLGKHGVELEEKAVEQIKKLHALYPESIIGIDIGVTEKGAEKLVSVGASKLIAGSAILDSDDPQRVFNNLSNII